MSKKNMDQLLGHSADNDGIEEYDNPLPDWWMGLFAFTVVFAVVYPVYTHGVVGWTQASGYDAEMAAATARWPQSEAPKELSFDGATLAEGEEIFATTCVSCHSADLTGGIGPNLIDAEWIHGGAPDQVLATITNGVASKGMPAWGGILGPDKVSKVAAFVISKGDKSAKPGKKPKKEKKPKKQEQAAPPPAGDAGADPGLAIYKANCVSCHGPDMKGLVGPNLIDDEWIHGGELDQIIHTITVGVPEKGMLSWGPILGEEKIRQVAQFVHKKANE